MIFYLHLDYLQIYDFEGNLLIERNNQHFHLNDKSEDRMYFISPMSCDEFVYVVKTDVLTKEFDENFGSIKEELQIWNWNGELIKRYSLNKPIIEFTMSNNCDKVIGLSYEIEDILVTYDIPND